MAVALSGPLVGLGPVFRHPYTNKWAAFLAGGVVLRGDERQGGDNCRLEPPNRGLGAVGSRGKLGLALD